MSAVTAPSPGLGQNRPNLLHQGHGVEGFDDDVQGAQGADGLSHPDHLAADLRVGGLLTAHPGQGGQQLEGVGPMLWVLRIDKDEETREALEAWLAEGHPEVLAAPAGDATAPAGGGGGKNKNVVAASGVVAAAGAAGT